MRPPRGADGVLAEGPRRAPRAPARCRRRLKYARRCPDRRHNARWRRGEAGDPWRGRGERLTAFFIGNLDYILLAYRLEFVPLAITLLGLRTTVASPLPWKWLGVSAVFLGLSAWTDMFTLAAGHRAGVDALRIAFFIVGGAFLVEFARACWAAVGGARVGRWVIVALLALTAVGGIAGLRGLGATAGLWRYQRAGGKHGRPLLLAAAAMALFVVAESVVTLKAAVPPATWINQESFLSAVGFPVQLVCMALGVPFVVGLWLYYLSLIHI